MTEALLAEIALKRFHVDVRLGAMVLEAGTGREIETALVAGKWFVASAAAIADAVCWVVTAGATDADNGATGAIAGVRG